MKAVIAAVWIVLAFTSIARAGMRVETMDDRMYFATHAVRATAMIASAYQNCEVQSSKLLDTMIDWASSACHASEDERARLRQAYEDELKQAAGAAPAGRCKWGTEQAESEFQSDLTGVQSFTRKPCPD